MFFKTCVLCGKRFLLKKNLESHQFWEHTMAHATVHAKPEELKLPPILPLDL